jgi:hypothetical protein
MRSLWFVVSCLLITTFVCYVAAQTAGNDAIWVSPGYPVLVTESDSYGNSTQKLIVMGGYHVEPTSEPLCAVITLFDAINPLPEGYGSYCGVCSVPNELGDGIWLATLTDPAVLKPGMSAQV